MLFTYGLLKWTCRQLFLHIIFFANVTFIRVFKQARAQSAQRIIDILYVTYDMIACEVSYVYYGTTLTWK